MCLTKGEQFSSGLPGGHHHPAQPLFATYRSPPTPTHMAREHHLPPTPPIPYWFFDGLRDADSSGADWPFDHNGEGPHRVLLPPHPLCGSVQLLIFEADGRRQYPAQPPLYLPRKGQGTLRVSEKTGNTASAVLFLSTSNGPVTLTLGLGTGVSGSRKPPIICRAWVFPLWLSRAHQPPWLLACVSNYIESYLKPF